MRGDEVHDVRGQFLNVRASHPSTHPPADLAEHAALDPQTDQTLGHGLHLAAYRERNPDHVQSAPRDLFVGQVDVHLQLDEVVVVEHGADEYDVFCSGVEQL